MFRRSLQSLAIACALLASASSAARAADDARLKSAEAAIEQEIARSGADVGVAFGTLDGKQQWFFHADDVFHAASTMKVPVLIELFHQVQEGKLKLDDTVVVRNEFHSLVDGSIYKLSAEDDSEAGRYKAEGQTSTLRDLAELMITASSNFATNLLIEKLGVDNIRKTVHALHADGMNVLRGVEDGKAYDKGLNNTTTARGLFVLLTAIANGKAVDPAASKEMIAILARQKFNEAIPAGLPPGTPVAHKTGEITKIHHDAAIVFAPRPFVLVILVRGIEDRNASAALMASIAKQLYEASQ